MKILNIFNCSRYYIAANTENFKTWIQVNKVTGYLQCLSFIFLPDFARLVIRMHHVSFGFAIPRPSVFIPQLVTTITKPLLTTHCARTESSLIRN